MKAVLILLALGACVTSSQVGPFVKHVQRNGDFLVVHKCIIILEGDEIREGGCAAEQIPLRSIPMVPQGPQPVMPPSPMAPQPVMPPSPMAPQPVAPPRR